jgi:hypothetical protein
MGASAGAVPGEGTLPIYKINTLEIRSNFSCASMVSYRKSGEDKVGILAVKY